MRNGFILMFVLLIMSAVALLTLGALTLATHESVIAAAQLNQATQRRQPEHALRALARSWDSGAMMAMTVGDSARIASEGVTIVVRRTAWGTYHAQTAGAEAIYRSIDFGRGITEANHAVVLAGSVLAVQANLATEDTASCTLPMLPEQPAALLTVAERRHAPGLVGAHVDSAAAVLPAGYALAGLRWSELEPIADHVLGPTADWSSPDTAASTSPLYYAPSHLHITGGTRQGMLLVNGNLQLSGNAGFTGIVVVRGVANIADGARIHGALRIQGSGLSSIGAASITHSRCTIGRVLLSTSSAARLIKTQRQFIPAF